MRQGLQFLMWHESHLQRRRTQLTQGPPDSTRLWGVWWFLPLVSLIFLKRSLVFPILYFPSISLHWSPRKAFLSLLAFLWNSAFKWVSLSYSPLLSLFFFSQSRTGGAGVAGGGCSSSSSRSGISSLMPVTLPWSVHSHLFFMKIFSGCHNKLPWIRWIKGAFQVAQW